MTLLLYQPQNLQSLTTCCQPRRPTTTATTALLPPLIAMRLSPGLFSRMLSKYPSVRYSKQLRLAWWPLQGKGKGGWGDVFAFSIPDLPSSLAVSLQGTRQIAIETHKISLARTDYPFTKKRFHLTSRRPHWRSKKMKSRPCWCNKEILWELNFLYKNAFFCSDNLSEMLATQLKTFYRMTLTNEIFYNPTVQFARGASGTASPTSRGRLHV